MILLLHPPRRIETNNPFARLNVIRLLGSLLELTGLLGNLRESKIHCLCRNFHLIGEQFHCSSITGPNIFINTVVNRFINYEFRLEFILEWIFMNAIKVRSYFTY